MHGGTTSQAIHAQDHIRPSLTSIARFLKSQARGDRPTALVSPATGKLGEQRLGVTRALGDFYMQTRGASHVPSVSCIDLRDVAEEVSDTALKRYPHCI